MVLLPGNSNRIVKTVFTEKTGWLLGKRLPEKIDFNPRPFIKLFPLCDEHAIIVCPVFVRNHRSRRRGLSFEIYQPTDKGNFFMKKLACLLLCLALLNFIVGCVPSSSDQAPPPAGNSQTNTGTTADE